MKTEYKNKKANTQQTQNVEGQEPKTDDSSEIKMELAKAQEALKKTQEELDFKSLELEEAKAAQPVQVEKPIEPKAAQAAREKKALRNRTVAKPGMDKNIGEMLKRDIQAKHINRRRLLVVPDEIRKAHPDKHFCFLSMKELEKNGMWHPNGYELLKSDDLPDHMQSQYSRSPDGFVHRREMVLGYISKEEHELRKMEKEVLKGNRDISDIITKNPALSNFQPYADRTTETLAFPSVEKES